MKYKVSIRKELAKIKEEAKQLDGLIFEFDNGWLIDDEDSIYNGETAMIPRSINYPLDAPKWLACGDLVAVKD